MLCVINSWKDYTFNLLDKFLLKVRYLITTTRLRKSEKPQKNLVLISTNLASYAEPPPLHLKAFFSDRKIL